MSSPVEQEQNLDEQHRHTEAQSIFFRPIELYVPRLQQEQPLLAKRHSTTLSMIDADENHKRKKTSHP